MCHNSYREQIHHSVFRWFPLCLSYWKYFPRLFQVIFMTDNLSCHTLILFRDPPQSTLYYSCCCHVCMHLMQREGKSFPGQLMQFPRFFRRGVLADVRMFDLYILVAFTITSHRQLVFTSYSHPAANTYPPTWCFIYPCLSMRGSHLLRKYKSEFYGLYYQFFWKLIMLNTSPCFST